MAVYAVGDIQGCHDELLELLDKLKFDPGHDRLWFVGDLVNRGRQSLETLRTVRELGDSAVCVLGNHDLHLLAIALGDHPPKPDPELRPVLNAPDWQELCDWLRSLPLAHYDETLDTLMVHAGVIPDWTVEDVLQLAGEVEQEYGGPRYREFFNAMYGDRPTRWSVELNGTERRRFVLNCLTRIRYCHPDGRLDFDAKTNPAELETGLVPWFELPGRRTAGHRIVFGHWSTLGYHSDANVLALDTGCVWGGTLTAQRLDAPAPPVAVASRHERPH